MSAGCLIAMDAGRGFRESGWRAPRGGFLVWMGEMGIEEEEEEEGEMGLRLWREGEWVIWFDM